MHDSLTFDFGVWDDMRPAVPSTSQLHAVARQDAAAAYALVEDWMFWYHDLLSETIETRAREILEREGVWDEDRQDWSEESVEAAEAEASEWFIEVRPDLHAEYWRLHQWAWRQGHSAQDRARLRSASDGRGPVEEAVRLGMRARRSDRRNRPSGAGVCSQSSPVMRIARPRERRERRASSSSSGGDGSGLAGDSDGDPEPPPGVASAGALRHISIVLADWLEDVSSRRAA